MTFGGGARPSAPGMTRARANAAVYLFLVWSCTRTYASLIFLLISVSGAVRPARRPGHLSSCPMPAGPK